MTMPKYRGLLVYQRESEEALPLFVFAAKAADLLSWTRILRTAEVPGAAQRLENRAHIKSIRSYVEAASGNIIPTSVTLTIEAEHYKLHGLPRKRVRRP